MEVRLRKWGNSLGLRITSHIAHKLEIDENSSFEIGESENSLILTKKTNHTVLIIEE